MAPFGEQDSGGGEPTDSAGGLLRLPDRSSLLADFADLLPDATFVVDRTMRVVAWNRACEELTGVGREALLGRDAYSEAFHGERRPMLIDLLDAPPNPITTTYERFGRAGRALWAEAYLPRLRAGQGAHVWGTASPLLDGQGERYGAIQVVRDVSESWEAHRALRESEEQFRLIMENLADLVAVLDRDGRRIYNSPSYGGLLGDHRTLSGTNSFEQIHPDDRERVESTFRETVRTGIGQRLEYRLIDEQGGVRAIESQGSAIRDDQGNVVKVVVVSRDVTQSRRAHARLEASERKYRELVELANSIILRWTRDGRVVFLNEFGQRFFGYTEEEILGRHVVGTIVPEIGAGGRDLSSLMARICDDPSAFERNVNQNVRRDGEEVWVAWTNRVVLDDAGSVTEILSVGHDVTEQRRAELALQELNASLERRVAERTAELAEARDRAEESDRLKSAFLATMSHELRTPLNSILGFTGILLQGLAGPLSEEQTRQLGMVQTAGKHLLSLIGDILDISRIEAGRVEVRLSTFDLSEAVRRVTVGALPLAQRKSLSLEVAVSPDVGTITSDQRRVEQILLNLVGNAIKFTERGGVTVECERQGPSVAVRVRDTGIGIRAEDVSRLFEPFRQLDTGLARQHEGTGLGLAICRRLAERLGGTVDVASVWGEGSTFTLTLPVETDGGG